MRSLTTFWILVIIATLPQAVLAADKQDKAARRAAILMQKMKQDMDAEKSALQNQFEQDKHNMDAQLSLSREQQQRSADKLRAQLQKSQQLEAESRKQAQLQEKTSQELAALQVAFDALQGQHTALQQRLDESHRTVAEMRAQQASLLSSASGAQQSLTVCEAKNRQLYQYGQELVGLYADASTYEKVMRQESFFQLKRVELENVLQDRADRLLDNRIQ